MELFKTTTMSVIEGALGMNKNTTDKHKKKDNCQSQPT